MRYKLFTFKNLSFFYLGFAISHFGNVPFYDWKFYAIIVPFVILNAFHKDEK